MLTFEPGRTDAATATVARVPHHPDNNYHPFVFMHHSLNGWECAPLLDADGRVVRSNDQIVYEILPALRKFKIQPGIHGIRQGKTAQDGANWYEAKTRRENEGWRFLPKNVIVAALGARGLFAFGEWVPGGYSVTYPGARGEIHADAWCRPVVRGVGSAAKTFWESDPLGFAMFRRELLKRGHIDAPEAASVEALIRVQESRAGRRLNDVHIPSVADRVARENHKLASLHAIAASGSLTSDAPVAPPVKGGAKRGPGRPPKSSPLQTARESGPLADPEDE